MSDDLMDLKDEFGGFSTSDNPFSQHLNSQDFSGELIETLMKLPAIGLKLQISPSLLKNMKMNTKSKGKKMTNHARETSHYKPSSPKASTLGAVMLQIGSWQLVARNEGDLVAKFYYAKKKLVWEILRNGLKEKMEINWSDIIGIRATMEENKPETLEIELQNSPKFHKEIEPEPRKHTKWTNGSDFTNGQADINRRHFAVFPPRVLEKHYQNLLKHDTNLSELSQRPFPTLNFPYFPSVFYNQYAIQFEESRFKVPSGLQFDGHQSFPQNYHQRMELLNQETKNQRTYENEYAYLRENPIFSSIYLADQEQDIAFNVAYEQDLSVHTEHLNGRGVSFSDDPQLNNVRNTSAIYIRHLS